MISIPQQHRIYIKRTYPTQTPAYTTYLPNLNTEQVKVLDIKARGRFPANVLSNFSDTKFQFDGVQINSMEGFLQSLKVKDPDEQRKLCLMSGFDAKKASKSIKRAKDDLMLFWNNHTFRKDSPMFREILAEVLAQKNKNLTSSFFEWGGKTISSINAFLLALKEKDPKIQVKICSLPSEKLKDAARNIHLTYDTRTLYWNGKSFKRDSQEYKKLLQRVYAERYKQDPLFRRALRASKQYILRHTIGKNDINSTILTQQEFIDILNELRGKDNFYYKTNDYFTSKMPKFLHNIKTIVFKHKF